jgi:hypothetical protein
MLGQIFREEEFDGRGLESSQTYENRIEGITRLNTVMLAKIGKENLVKIKIVKNLLFF